MHRGPQAAGPTNRLEEHRQSTVKALAGLGLNTNNIEKRLLLKRKGETSNKSLRREAVEAVNNVLLYVGDNLRDFSETFAAPNMDSGNNQALLQAMQARSNQVDAAASHWGIDWFILPNPLYGEWEKFLGEQPKLKLRPTKMKLPGQ